jgi:hypothetical protein
MYGLCLFTASLSLTFATTRQWSLSQSAALNDRTSSTFECLRLSTRIWSIGLWFNPSGDVHVYLQTSGPHYTEDEIHDLHSHDTAQPGRFRSKMLPPSSEGNEDGSSIIITITILQEIIFQKTTVFIIFFLQILCFFSVFVVFGVSRCIGVMQ